MRCIVSYFILYFIPNLLTTRVNFIPFLLWHHNPGVIGVGSYPNDQRYLLSAVCVIIPAWTIPNIRSHHLKTALGQRHIEPRLQVPHGQHQELLHKQHNGK